MSTKISASMIVKNEEQILEECLCSIQGIDEIVILDTGSADATPDIARRYTEKVFVGEYVWNDNFAEARNISLSRCTGDWIFIVDADEKLVTGIESLYGAISQAGEENLLNVKVVSDKTSFWSPRLFRNGIGIAWIGAIHNYLNRTASKKTSVIIECGYSPTHKADPDRAFRILAKQVSENPDCVREKYYFAREHYYRKDWQAAIEWFKKYLQVATWGPEWADAHYLKALCHVGTGESNKARTECLNALNINADFKDALLLMTKLTGPKNRAKWEQYAALSTNDDVLFIRS